MCESRNGSQSYVIIPNQKIILCYRICTPQVHRILINLYATEIPHRVNEKIQIMKEKEVKLIGQSSIQLVLDKNE